MTKVFINGFGRIGRTVLRAWAQGAAPEIEIVGLNDKSSPETCAHLFEFDSTFGPYPGIVQLNGDMLIVDQHSLPIHTTEDILNVDLSDIDVLMDCTGTVNTHALATRGLICGAKRILISGPSSAAQLTMVLGANDDLLEDQELVSNASCTTNALAPLVKLIDDNWGVINGWMTTVHCFTGSQPSIDQPRNDLARSRAASLSMVPTTTSAEQLLDKVLPQTKGRIECAAVRVPVASVSAIDLTVTLSEAVSLEDVNKVLATQTGIIGSTAKQLVSSDLRARPESIVVALRETRVTRAGLVRIFGWYDNEWGFSHRMLEVANLMGKTTL